MTKYSLCIIINTEKGKTLNGYAKYQVIKRITLMLCKGWRYFFMVMINTIKVIIYIIMYTYSIATTSFRGDDGITAQLLRSFRSYLLLDFSNKNILQHILYFLNIFLENYNVLYKKTKGKACRLLR